MKPIFEDRIIQFVIKDQVSTKQSILFDLSTFLQYITTCVHVD